MGDGRGMTGALAAHLGRFRHARWTIVLTSLAAVAQAAMGIPIAWMLRGLFDAGAHTALQVGAEAAAVVALYLAGDALLLLVVRRNLTVVKRVIADIRLQVLEAVSRRPLAMAPTQSVGDAHAALVHDAERVDEMSAGFLCRLLPAGLSLVVLAGVLAALSPALLAVAAAVLPVAWLVARPMRRAARVRIEAFHAGYHDYSTGTLDLLARLPIAQSQGAVRTELGRHRGMAETLRTRGDGAAWGATALAVLQNQSAVLTAIAVLLAGRLLVASGRLDNATLLAFYVVLAMTRSHLSAVAVQWPAMVVGLRSLDRLQAVMGERWPAPYRGDRPHRLRGAVAATGIAYGYGDAPLLDGAGVVTRPGSVSALAGPNGSGKTTLVRLILGFDRPARGELRADGIAYDEIAMDELRAQIGFAPQDPAIFAGTVRENLAFGLAGEPSAAAVEQALAIAGAGFVDQLGGGLEAWLGENGVRLSGGQRQRLSIARAVLRAPALLILDEPTNHLGGAQARAIIARFRAARPDGALLLISHDPEMLALADEVFDLTPPARLPAAA